jgi:hypothetical protein
MGVVGGAGAARGFASTMESNAVVKAGEGGSSSGLHMLERTVVPAHAGASKGKVMIVGKAPPRKQMGSAAAAFEEDSEDEDDADAAAAAAYTKRKGNFR